MNNNYWRNVNIKREEQGQVNIDQALDLDWQHARDIDHNHTQCPGEVIIIYNNEHTRVSRCTTCGLVVESTLTTVTVQRG